MQYDIEMIRCCGGGTDGTLGREKAEYEINLKDGVFNLIMHKCPSVANRYGFEMFHDIIQKISLNLY